MKKIIIAFGFMTMILSSCRIDDDTTRFFYEVIPIQSADFPAVFHLGETYDIDITYLQPTDCYEFADFYYEKELNRRTIAVECRVMEGKCNTLTDVYVTKTLKFYVTSNGSYVFNLWKGIDENDNKIFETIEIPVVE